MSLNYICSLANNYFIGTRSVLQTDEVLKSGDFLMSKNRKYVLLLQEDGNLVLYKCFNANCPNSSGKRDIWASNTYGKGNPPYSLVIQRDNVLVIYDTNKHPIWWNSLTILDRNERVTFQWTSNAYAVLLDDGNFVVYDSQQRLMWDTATYDGEKGVYGSGRKHKLSLF